MDPCSQRKSREEIEMGFQNVRHRFERKHRSTRNVENHRSRIEAKDSKLIYADHCHICSLSMIYSVLVQHKMLRMVPYQVVTPATHPRVEQHKSLLSW